LSSYRWFISLSQYEYIYQVLVEHIRNQEYFSHVDLRTRLYIFTTSATFQVSYATPVAYRHQSQRHFFRLVSMTLRFYFTQKTISYTFK